MYDEGVIKFGSDHETVALEPRRYGGLACQLMAWREVMARVQLVGQRPDRYGGAGYGNVSARVGAPSAALGQRAFLITGTQTAGYACISLDDFCVVDRYHAGRNRVQSRGRVQPSSESLTHGAIYDLSPTIRFVLHAHTPTIWQRAAELAIPTTDPKVPYGTPEMAAEVGRLWRTAPLAQRRILSMGGHEDGIIVFGRTADEAGQVLVTYLARAYQSECAARGLGLCTED
jgi:L-ribulose-5-phosphate 4-epimerase